MDPLAAFLQQTSTATACFRTEEPVDLSWPDEKIEQYLDNARLVFASTRFLYLLGYKDPLPEPGTSLKKLIRGTFPQWFSNIGHGFADLDFKLIERVISYPNSDGQMLHAKFELQGVFTEDGRLSDIWVSSRNVTEEIRTQEKLAEEQRTLSMALAATQSYRFEIHGGEGISFSDSALQFFAPELTEANQPMEVMRSLVEPSSLPGLLDVAQALFRGETGSAHAELQLDSRLGADRWIELWIMPGESRADGTVKYAIAVFREISERKRREQRELTHHKLESLGTLSGGVAHDFNNLLAAISGNAELLRLQFAPGDEPEEMQKIMDAATTAAELCNQMLAFAGDGSLSTELNDRLDLADLVQSSRQLIQSTTHNRVTLSAQALEPAVCLASRSQLNQVLMNLVINAAESFDGPGYIRIRTGIKEMSAVDLEAMVIGEDLAPGSYALLEVEDSGDGLASDVMARMFDPFYTTKFAGRGMGLAVVAGIVKRHCGGIRVDSHPSAGTRVQVAFPAALPEQPTPVNRRSRLHLARFMTPQDQILIVDDVADVSTVFARFVQVCGGTPIAVSTADDARASLATSRCRCAIVDLTMPDTDGISLARELREIDPEMAVVITSGYADHTIPDDLPLFLHKPFKLEDFRNVIEPLFRQVPAISK